MTFLCIFNANKIILNLSDTSAACKTAACVGVTNSCRFFRNGGKHQPY